MWDRYNTVRLRSAIGFITRADMLAGWEAENHASRDHSSEQTHQRAGSPFALCLEHHGTGRPYA
jgi:hypothetical protein